MARSSYLVLMLMAFFVLGVNAPRVTAQGGVGSTRGLPDSAAGIHSIQGRVFLPDGRRAGPGILVKLEGNVVGSRTLATTGDGSFVFNQIPASEYTVVVDGGDEYDSVRQSVTIYGTTGGAGVGRAGQTVQVDIHLNIKGAAAAEAKLFEGVPKPAVESYKKGVQAAQSGDAKKAVEFFNKALSLHPNFIPALSALGDQYGKLNEMSKLAETMDALLKLQPDDAHAHLNMGIALFSQKKFPEAEQHLRETLKTKSGDAVAHYYLGMTLVSTRQYAEAEQELELAIRSGGEKMALAHKYLGGLYMSSRKNEQAAAELEKYLQLDPKAADAERIKGTIKELRKQ